MNRLIYSVCLVFLASCSSEISREVLLTNATGTPGNIQVLMENDLWNGPIGQTVTVAFEEYAAGVYLRPESTFDYFQIGPSQFDGALRKTRNIFQIRLRNDTSYTESVLKEYVDLYAYGQYYVQIVDSDENRLLQTVREKMPEVVDMFNASENSRLVNQFNKDFHLSIDESAQKNMGFSIHLPVKSELKVEEEGFMWIKHDRSQTQMSTGDNQFDSGTFWIQQGFVLWETPYSDSALNVSNILMDRDTILKYNVPGKIKGSYMGTEYDEYYSPEAKEINYNGSKAVKMYGLWKHKGDVGAFGGGPFVQISIQNEARNSVINVCGYIYAPKFDKREYIREIDALLETITLL
ncbi:MAG: DUF4837 family protein [Crocinitomicaceae bacterium]|nr:DUF4837 family protein [Crocinitomicaceae bacterium]